ISVFLQSPHIDHSPGAMQLLHTFLASIWALPKPEDKDVQSFLDQVAGVLKARQVVRHQALHDESCPIKQVDLNNLEKTIRFVFDKKNPDRTAGKRSSLKKLKCRDLIALGLTLKIRELNIYGEGVIEDLVTAGPHIGGRLNGRILSNPKIFKLVTGLELELKSPAYEEFLLGFRRLWLEQNEHSAGAEPRGTKRKKITAANSPSEDTVTVRIASSPELQASSTCHPPSSPALPSDAASSLGSPTVQSVSYQTESAPSPSNMLTATPVPPWDPVTSSWPSSRALDTGTQDRLQTPPAAHFVLTSEIPLVSTEAAQQTTNQATTTPLDIIRLGNEWGINFMQPGGELAPGFYQQEFSPRHY
ncbi:hypothetical protein GGTG_14363, partial [Gaeumannomyces tritici R3-111a-1]